MFDKICLFQSHSSILDSEKISFLVGYPFTAEFGSRLTPRYLQVHVWLSFVLHACFFYKTTLYKDVHDENGQKIKNIVHCHHQNFNFFCIFSNADRTFSIWLSWPILFHLPYCCSFPKQFEKYIFHTFIYFVLYKAV